MSEKGHLAARPSRILVLGCVGSLLVFLLSASLGSAASTHSVKVGGESVGPPLAKGGVVWFNGYDAETIVIRPGDTVQWRLIGGIHTVTSTLPDPQNASRWAYDSSPLFPVEAALFDMSPGRLLPPGSVYELDTNTVAQGPYNYFCKIHPGMQGNITITGGIPVDEVVHIVAGWGDPIYAVQAFAPENVDVPQGTKVRWTLINPTEPHTITENLAGGAVWDSSPDLPPGLPPVMTVPGTLFSWTFEREGTFTYFCKLHAYKIGESWVGMVGTVIVERATDEVLGLPLTYLGLATGVAALLIGLGAVGVARRRGGGGPPPPNP